MTKWRQGKKTPKKGGCTSAADTNHVKWEPLDQNSTCVQKDDLISDRGRSPNSSGAPFTLGKELKGNSYSLRSLLDKLKKKKGKIGHRGDLKL